MLGTKKLKRLDEDCFIKVMKLAEAPTTADFIALLEGTSARDYARLYVAALLLQGKEFPAKVYTSKYSFTLQDPTVFFELYKRAVCGGISSAYMEELYDTSKLPEMIWTEDNRKREPVYQVKPSEDGTFDELLLGMGVKPLYTVLKPGACPLSADARNMRKKGAEVTSYKVIVNKKAVIINAINYNGDMSYDINCLYCRDTATFKKIFAEKFMNKFPGGRRD